MRKSTLTIVTCVIIGISALMNIAGTTLVFSKGTTMFGLYYLGSIIISCFCIYLLWELKRLALIIYTAFFALSIIFFAMTGTLGFFKPFFPVVIIILMLINYKNFKTSTKQNQASSTFPIQSSLTKTVNEIQTQEDKGANKRRVVRIISVITAVFVAPLILLSLVMSHDSPASQGDNMLSLINFAMVLVPAVILTISLKSKRFYWLWLAVAGVVLFGGLIYGIIGTLQVRNKINSISSQNWHDYSCINLAANQPFYLNLTLDGSGRITYSDYSMKQFETSYVIAQINQDGGVDFNDKAVLSHDTYLDCKRIDGSLFKDVYKNVTFPN